jgi:hypothetical protein
MPAYPNPNKFPFQVHWTKPMLDLLKTLRKSGHPILTCAAQIGVANETCRKKLIELNLNQRMNKGRIRGVYTKQKS